MFRAQKVQIEKVNFLQALNEKIFNLTPCAELDQLLKNLNIVLAEDSNPHNKGELIFSHTFIQTF